MRKLASRSGFAAWTVGALILLQVAAAGLLFSADNDFVYFLNRPIHYVCAARQHFGVPCPTCGFSRGFVLSIHGRIGDAWRLSPSGPLAAIGLLVMGAALVVFGTLQMKRPRHSLARTEAWLRAGALSYGAIAMAIWAISWVSTILRVRAW